MARRKNTKAVERAAHLAKLAQLYLRGMTNQYDLAGELGVTQQSISRDLKILQKRWLDNADGDISERRAAQLARVEDVLREAWAAWERSKNEKETTITEQQTTQPALAQSATPGENSAGGSASGGTAEMKTKAHWRRVGQTGNPSHMGDIEWAIEETNKLLGLYPAQPQQPNLNQVNISANISVESKQFILHLRERLQTATPEERAAIYAAYDAMEAAAEQLQSFLSEGTPQLIEGTYTSKETADGE
jgi:hypothetical protein